MFNLPHGLYVDNEGKMCDERAKNGKGAVVVKFSPQGQVLLSLQVRNALQCWRLFGRAEWLAAPPNGDICVADRHGGNTNDRIVKFAKDDK